MKDNMKDKDIFKDKFKEENIPLSTVNDGKQHYGDIEHMSEANRRKDIDVAEEKLNKAVPDSVHGKAVEHVIDVQEKRGEEAGEDLFNIPLSTVNDGKQHYGDIEHMSEANRRKDIDKVEEDLNKKVYDKIHDKAIMQEAREEEKYKDK